MFVSCIVPAAGRGIRLKSKIAKPLVRVGGQPLVIRTLKALSQVAAIREIIVVAHKRDEGVIQCAIAQARIKTAIRVVLGGRRRQDSVYNGLQHIDQRAGIVIVHDAARPFVESAVIKGVIRAAERWGAAVAAVPLKPTVKRVDALGRVTETPLRDGLFEIQTPQGFKTQLLRKAYQRFGCDDVTDDASLVEKLGVAVHIAAGSYSNIKITTPEDLVFAKAIIQNKS